MVTFSVISDENEKLVRQHVIVMRGRFAVWESPVLDPDIMVEVHVNTKE